MKVELFSDVKLWKRILDFMQHSLNEKSLIPYPECQGAQDKQRIQYLFILGKTEDTHLLLKIPKSYCPDVWIGLQIPNFYAQCYTEKGWFLFVYLDDAKLFGKKQYLSGFESSS